MKLDEPGLDGDDRVLMADQLNAGAQTRNGGRGFETLLCDVIARSE